MLGTWNSNPYKNILSEMSVEPYTAPTWQECIEHPLSSLPLCRQMLSQHASDFTTWHNSKLCVVDFAVLIGRVSWFMKLVFCAEQICSVLVSTSTHYCNDNIAKMQEDEKKNSLNFLM